MHNRSSQKVAKHKTFTQNPTLLHHSGSPKCKIPGHVKTLEVVKSRLNKSLQIRSQDKEKRALDAQTLVKPLLSTTTRLKTAMPTHERMKISICPQSIGRSPSRQKRTSYHTISRFFRTYSTHVEAEVIWWEQSPKIVSNFLSRIMIWMRSCSTTNLSTKNPKTEVGKNQMFRFYQTPNLKFRKTKLKEIFH